MIVLVWRLFCRYVIGTGLITPKCKASDYCHRPQSEICVRSWCRWHCAHETDHMSRRCQCESKGLSVEERQMVAEYRKANQPRQIEGA